MKTAIIVEQLDGGFQVEFCLRDENNDFWMAESEIFTTFEEACACAKGYFAE